MASLSVPKAYWIFTFCHLPPLLLSQYPLPKSVGTTFSENPLIWGLIIHSIPIFALGFTKANSLWRIAIVPLSTLLLVAWLQASDQIFSNGSLAAVCSGPSTVNVLATITFLALRKLEYVPGKDHEMNGKRSMQNGHAKDYSLTDGGTNNQNGHAKDDSLTNGGRINHNGHAKNDSLLDVDHVPAQSVGLFSEAKARLLYGYRTYVNYRYIGTPLQLRNVANFSSKDPNYVPTRARFLIDNMIRVVVAYLITDFISHRPPPDLKLFAIPTRALLFGGSSQLNLQPLVLRVATTVIFWFVLRLSIDLVYRLTCIVFVGLGQEPKDWPLYFGSVTDAWSLRRFWSIYWHQALRTHLVANAEFFTHSLLRLRKGGLMARYMNLFFVFAGSGIKHIVSDVAAGIPLDETGALPFFAVQAFGVMFEDAVKALWQRYNKNEAERKVKRWQKILGYVWVLAFMVWSTPAWSYHHLGRQRLDKDYLFVFSISQWASAAT